MKTKTLSPTRPVIALLTVLLALGGLRAFGQGAAGGGRQKLTFLAMGADGQPIADLQPAQVEVKIDGKVRAIQSLHLVRLAATEATPAAGAAAPKGVFDSPVAPPFGTNTVAPARSVMLIVDEESMRPGSDKVLRDALDQFVTGLGAQDRVGLMTVPHGSISVPLTNSKSTLHDAIAKVGGRQPGTRTDSEDTCHARDVLDNLTPAIAALGEGPTTVAFFSSGLVAPSSTTKPPSGGNVTCNLTTTEFQKLGTATAGAHATVYVILPETGVKANDMAGLQTAAGAVNSPLLYLTGGDGAMTRVMRESAAYYVGEIDYDAAERDGKSHRVDLKVTAANASVRGPSEVVFAKTDAKAGKLSAKDIVKETKIYTDLPIRTIGFVSRGTGEKIKIVALVEPVEAGVKLASASIGLVDTGDKSGKMISYSANEQDILKPTILTAMEVAPGTYRLHAAAVDASGRAGSADFTVDASLTPAGPMKMSGLSLGITSATGWAPKMEFKDDKEVTAYFELYGTTTSGISASAELAETTDGPAIQTADPATKSLTINGTNEPGRFIVLANFDLTALKPGDYVIRATFTVQDTPPGKVFRTLRKVK